MMQQRKGKKKRLWCRSRCARGTRFCECGNALEYDREHVLKKKEKEKEEAYAEGAGALSSKNKGSVRGALAPEQERPRRQETTERTFKNSKCPIPDLGNL